MLKKLVVFAFVAVLFASCSSGPSVVGHWRVDSVIMDGEEHADRNEEKSLEFF